MSAKHTLVQAFGGLHVLVVGDATLDRYLQGSSDRLAREAPVPAVTVSSIGHAPGGAANAAANAAALGARVSLLSVVGDDVEAEVLRDELMRYGVDVSQLYVDPQRRTPVKSRVVVDGQVLLRFDEACGPRVDAAAQQHCGDRVAHAVAAADVVLVSDYGYGLLSDELVGALAQALQTRGGARPVVVVDAPDVARFAALRPTAATPSVRDLEQLLGPSAHGGDRVGRVLAAAADLPQRLGVQSLAVTLDRDGVVLCQTGRPPHRTYSPAVPERGACGAGDVFTASLALALAAGASPVDAADLAQAAVTACLGRPGTCVCHADELTERLTALANDVPELPAVLRRIERVRAGGGRIVLTNGCFDLLHRGHVDFLAQARALGDFLVVGVNSDESIRRLKGPQRPVNPLEDRARVLQALDCVDAIVPFDADTAAGLVELIRPETYAKGGDYVSAMLPEASVVERLGGTVRILPYLEDRSTTRMIELIRVRGDAP